jgi:hypothetical protein
MAASSLPALSTPAGLGGGFSDLWVSWSHQIIPAKTRARIRRRKKRDRFLFKGSVVS